MAHDIDYGNLTKRIVFTENDHRHAKLLIRLRHDKLTQSDFFRYIVSAYIDGDRRIQSYIDEIKQQPLKQKTRSRKLCTQGNQKIDDFGLSSEEVDNIFDVLKQGFPEL